MKRITVLHIVKYDRKFFSPTISNFNSDGRLNNIVVILNTDRNRRIDDVGDSTIIMSSVKEVIDYVNTTQYDVVYFHSMPINHWKIVLAIPKQKKVIWWAWGYDLYQPQLGATPIIPYSIYKSQTYCLLKKTLPLVKKIALPIINLIRGCYYGYVIKSGLKRIDYFQPVTCTEYYMMKKVHPTFRADEFYFPIRLPDSINFNNSVEKNGIMFGNSATYTNNHLDTWQYIRDNISKKRRCIIPLSYGDSTYGKIVRGKIKGENVEHLTDFLPFRTYKELMDGCGYMVCGCVRQQAMGNISYAIKTGMKIFLFKDSIMYKYLNEIGVRVYPIEDVDNHSFEITPTKDEMSHNYCMYKKEISRRNSVYEDVLNFLQKEFGKEIM